MSLLWELRFFLLINNYLLWWIINILCAQVQWIPCWEFLAEMEAAAISEHRFLVQSRWHISCTYHGLRTTTWTFLLPPAVDVGQPADSITSRYWGSHETGEDTWWNGSPCGLQKGGGARQVGSLWDGLWGHGGVMRTKFFLEELKQKLSSKYLFSHYFI